MSVLEVLFVILIFIITYLMVQMSKVKRKLVRLIQENAVIWQFLKEQEDK
jgi:hypothetical protein